MRRLYSENIMNYTSRDDQCNDLFVSNLTNKSHSPLSFKRSQRNNMPQAYMYS